MSKKTYYIDTSVIPAAIGASTPEHNREFAKAVGNGKLSVTVYIRMELIRRVICDLCRLANVAAQFTSVNAFWSYYSQCFESRRLKVGMFAMSAGGNTLRSAATPAALAEEFATLAVHTLKRVDRKLPHSINPSKCRIGGSTLAVDYNKIVDDVGQFAIRFEDTITDCEINSYLKLANMNSESNRLLADVAAQEATAVQELGRIKSSGRWITCTQCKRIGDAVIALECPSKAVLVHGDAKSFPLLCKAVGKEEVYVQSVQSLQHEKPGWIWKISGKLPDASTRPDDGPSS